MEVAITSPESEFDPVTPDEFIFLVASPLLFQCELLNQEYVDLFARYLLLRIEQIRDESPRGEALIFSSFCFLSCLPSSDLLVLLTHRFKKR